MWKKYCTVGQATDDNIVRRMRIACGILKATNTHPEHVILTAFGRQQRLRESVPQIFLSEDGNRYSYRDFAGFFVIFETQGVG